MIGMPSCREASRLISESHERRLDLRERVFLRLHLAMCFMCRRFSRQIEFIGKAAQRFSLYEAHEPAHGPRLPSEARRRIAERIARETEDPPR